MRFFPAPFSPLHPTFIRPASRPAAFRFSGHPLRACPFCIATVTDKTTVKETRSDIVFLPTLRYNRLWLSPKMYIQGVCLKMNQEAQDEQALSWEEDHPWISQMTATAEDEDSIDEVIRYTLDELRLA